MNEYVVLVDYDGEEYEVDAADVEEGEHDGELGVWCCFEEDGLDEFFPYLAD